MQINRALHEHGGVGIKLDNGSSWYLFSTEAVQSKHGDCIWVAHFYAGYPEIRVIYPFRAMTAEAPISYAPYADFRIFRCLSS